MEKGELNFDIDLNSIGEEMITVDELQSVAATEATTPIAEEGAPSKEDDDDSNKFEVDAVPKTSTENSLPSQQAAASDSPTDKKIATLANALVEEGVLSTLPEDFDGSVAGLIKAIGGEIQYNNSRYKEDLPPVLKELINNYEENVPLDQLIGVKSKAIEYSAISDEQLAENVDWQEKLVADDLANRGLSPEKIQARLKLFRDSDTLATEAADAKVELVKLQNYKEDQIKAQSKLQQEQQQEANKQSLVDIQKAVEGTEEFIPGMKLNKATKDALYDSLTKVVAMDGQNPVNAVMQTRSKDPLGFEMKLHYLHQLGIFDGDWSKITTSAKTSAVSELESMLKSTSSFSGNNHGMQSKSSDNSTLNSLRGNA